MEEKHIVPHTISVYSEVRDLFMDMNSNIMIQIAYCLTLLMSGFWIVGVYF